MNARENRFQVNLQGLIELFADHLYSTPEVFVRELVQNAVDAVQARRTVAPDHPGEIRLELLNEDAPRPTLVFEDDGIGLTEQQIHTFLATIGESAKRGALPDRVDGYLGRFGVGLLSCFVVAEEIVVVTRSVKDGARPLEWRGRSDGTYEVRELESELAAGTKVYLTFEARHARRYDRDNLRRLVRRYGDFLPVPILWEDGHGGQRLNRGHAPWETPGGPSARAAAEREFANEELGFDPLDSFPIRSKRGGARGVAFVLPHSTSLAAAPRHRVYLKGVLLSDEVPNLLPRWAFFVRCVVQTTELRPTASRESLHEDELLIDTREELARSIRAAIVRIAEQEPERLSQLIRVHFRSLKALAVDDDELYRLLIPWFPFTTNEGEMTLQQILDAGKEVRYTSTVDGFRQVATVATGVSALVVNAGYTDDQALIERLDLYDSAITVKSVTLSDFASDFAEPKDAKLADRLAECASRALAGFDCKPLVRCFTPTDVPALFGLDPETQWRRTVERAQEQSSDLFSGVLGALVPDAGDDGPVLCLNLDNVLVQTVARGGDSARIDLALQVLYVHALMQARQPLGVRERKLLENGMLGLLEMGLATPEDGER